MSFSTGFGAGGGGFGGFPYRSSHQQGNDGNNNNNNNNFRRRRNNKSANRKRRGGPITFEACIQVPPPYRKFLIGKRGSTVKSLTKSTRCVINVPGKNQNDNPRAMVEIKASCVGYLMHGCWEVLNIVHNATHSDLSLDSKDGACTNDTLNQSCSCLEMNYTIKALGVLFPGKCRSSCSCQLALESESSTSTLPLDSVNTNNNLHTRNGAFLVGDVVSNDGVNSIGEMSAYCIPIYEKVLNKDDIMILIDNERFVDPDMTAKIDVIDRPETMNDIFSCSIMFKSSTNPTNSEGKLQQEQQDSTNQSSSCDKSHDVRSRMLLIFIHGSRENKTEELYRKLIQKISQLDDAR